MSKQVELNEVYETRGGEYTGQVISTNVEGRFPCAALYTNKKTGMNRVETITNYGTVWTDKVSEYDLIIPEPEPEPKYRAWKLEEIPVGEKVRFKTGKGYSTVILANIMFNDEPCLVLPYYFVLNGGAHNYALGTEYALREFEYFNGTEWQPCGVLE